MKTPNLPSFVRCQAAGDRAGAVGFTERDGRTGGGGLTTSGLRHLLQRTATLALLSWTASSSLPAAETPTRPRNAFGSPRVSTRVADARAGAASTPEDAWKGYRLPQLQPPVRRGVRTTVGSDIPSRRQGEPTPAMPASPLAEDRSAPRYADAVCSVPPVLLEVEEAEAARLRSATAAIGDDDSLTVGISESAATRESLRAAPIESFAPPPPPLEIVTRQLEKPAENALHIVRIRPSVLPVVRRGGFDPGSEGRLQRRIPVRLHPLAPAAAHGDDASAAHHDAEPSESTPRPRRVRARISAEQEPPRPPPLAPLLASLTRQPSPDPPESPDAGGEPERVPPEPIPVPQAPARAAPSTGGPDETFKRVGELELNIRPSAGDLPENAAAQRFEREPFEPHAMGYSRAATETEFPWTAPATCHAALLFEEVNLERHGHEVRVVQPVLSAAHFFGRVPAMPYLLISEKHRQCNYTLGHYRPGSCAPYAWHYPRLSLDGASLQAAVVVGLMYAIP